MAISLTSFSYGSIVYCSTAIILTLVFDVDVSVRVLACIKHRLCGTYFIWMSHSNVSREINLCHTHWHWHGLTEGKTETKRST